MMTAAAVGPVAAKVPAADAGDVQPGLFMRAFPSGAAACPQTGLSAAGHHTYRHLRDVRHGHHRCASITPGGT